MELIDPSWAPPVVVSSAPASAAASFSDATAAAGADHHHHPASSGGSSGLGGLLQLARGRVPRRGSSVASMTSVKDLFSLNLRTGQGAAAVAGGGSSAEEQGDQAGSSAAVGHSRIWQQLWPPAGRRRSSLLPHQGSAPDGVRAAVAAPASALASRNACSSPTTLSAAGGVSAAAPVIGVAASMSSPVTTTTTAGRRYIQAPLSSSTGARCGGGESRGSIDERGPEGGAEEVDILRSGGMPARRVASIGAAAEPRRMVLGSLRTSSGDSQQGSSARSAGSQPEADGAAVGGEEGAPNASRRASFPERLSSDGGGVQRGATRNLLDSPPRHPSRLQRSSVPASPAFSSPPLAALLASGGGAGSASGPPTSAAPDSTIDEPPGLSSFASLEEAAAARLVLLQRKEGPGRTRRRLSISAPAPPERPLLASVSSASANDGQDDLQLLRKESMLADAAKRAMTGSAGIAQGGTIEEGGGGEKGDGEGQKRRASQVAEEAESLARVRSWAHGDSQQPLQVVKRATLPEPSHQQQQLLVSAAAAGRGAAAGAHHNHAASPLLAAAVAGAAAAAARQQHPPAAPAGESRLTKVLAVRFCPPARSLQFAAHRVRARSNEVLSSADHSSLGSYAALPRASSALLTNLFLPLPPALPCTPYLGGGRRSVPQSAQSHPQPRQGAEPPLAISFSVPCAHHHVSSAPLGWSSAGGGSLCRAPVMMVVTIRPRPIPPLLLRPIWRPPHRLLLA